MRPALAILAFCLPAYALAQAPVSAPTSTAPASMAPAVMPPSKTLMPPTPTAAMMTAVEGAPAVIPCAKAPKGTACVEGGPFLRGTNDGPEMARPQTVVFQQTVYMDVNEVTYAEYKACEKARKCDRAGPKYRDFNRPEQPINGISWFDAVKYCKAHGKHLPTEAEWEKAARGTDGRLYPWGNDEVTCDRAVMKDDRGRSCGIKKKGQYPEKGRVLAVGIKPASLYGLKDMIGNSYEWVADWYTKSYEKCGAACQGINPKGPCGGTGEYCKGHRRKVVRGGSWYWGVERNNAVYRRAHIPLNKPAYHHFGFRCAASPQEAAKLAQ